MRQNRNFQDLREIYFETDINLHAEGSCLVKFGNTQVICTASIEDKTPHWLKNTGKGWVTAEYGMLPRSTNSRIDREAARGKQSGRTQEIQRLIGRSLRSVVNLENLGERQIKIDCDVLQADGGTRTAAISGGFIALHESIKVFKKHYNINKPIIKEYVAAVLMDEPLTVIDPDLKFRLRRKLKEINEEFKTTLVYVTHDQNEAMTFADNIIVMSEGEVVQAGTPKELFERPNTTFVGYFIGSPAMNLFETEASSNDSVKINNTIIKTNTNLSNLKDKKIKLGIRSEFIKIAKNQSENLLNVDVEKVEDLGNYKLLTAKMGNLTIKSKINRETEIPSSDVKLYIPPEKCCVYKEEKLI